MGTDPIFLICEKWGLSPFLPDFRRRSENAAPPQFCYKYLCSTVFTKHSIKRSSPCASGLSFRGDGLATPSARSSTCRSPSAWPRPATCSCGSPGATRSRSGTWKASSSKSRSTSPSASSCTSEEHTSELQSRLHLVCRLLLEKKKKIKHDFAEVVKTL